MLRWPRSRRAQASEDCITAPSMRTGKALNDRAADNWEPLFAIADLAGDEWPRLARTAAVKLSADSEVGAESGKVVARRHFALSRFDFRSFRVSGGKMTPGRDGYQSTNLPNTNERIPESHESLADSNVRGICFRGNPG
jgi:hypothetical protein